MKVAVVGAGGIAKVHLQAYKRMDDVNVVAFMDAAPERVRGLAEEWNVPVYTDFDEMLASVAVDVVDICAPTHVHKEYAIRAMDAGKHVVCEKPIAVDLESGEAMLAAAKANGVYFMVAHVVRFWPEFEYLKSAYENNVYGSLHHILFSRISRYPVWSSNGWMLEEDKSGLAPVDLHIHDTDFIHYMLGEPSDVRSHAVTHGSKISYIHTTYEFNELTVDAEGAWYPADIPFRAGFRAVFDQGVLEYRDGDLVFYGDGREPLRIEAGERITTNAGINVDSVYPYYAELRYFIDCVASGAPLEKATGESSIRSLRTVLSEVEAAKAAQAAMG